MTESENIAISPAVARSWLKQMSSAAEITWSRLSAQARIMHVVGLMVADDAGRVKRSDLETALAAPGVVEIAQGLIREFERARPVTEEATS